MDSEHRHELQKNDLEEFLLHWKEFWTKYGTHLLLVILVAMAVVVFYRWYSVREHNRLEAAYGELVDTSAPDTKQDVAVKYDHVALLPEHARLQAADITLQRALFADPSDPAAPVPTPQQTRDKLAEALKLYQRVAESGGVSLPVMNAHFGVAAVHESLGDFDAAAKQYEGIEKLAAERWPHLAAQARQLRESIDRIRQPVTLAEPTNLLQPAGPGAIDDLLNRFGPLGPLGPGTTDPTVPAGDPPPVPTPAPSPAPESAPDPAPEPAPTPAE